MNALYSIVLLYRSEQGSLLQYLPMVITTWISRQAEEGGGESGLYMNSLR